MAAKTDFHSARITIGARVEGTDGPVGTVRRVVVDPVARAVTHLAVHPAHRSGQARLVPLEMLDPAGAELRLACTVADFERLDLAEENRFLPSGDTYPDYPEDSALVWPYYEMGRGYARSLAKDTTISPDHVPALVATDIVPPGEVAVHRGERVHALDGEIGRVHGVVIDMPDHRMTYVLLQEGHLFGRKSVAIPIGAVTSVEAGIDLNLTKQQVEDLPAIDVEWSGDRQT